MGATAAARDTRHDLEHLFKLRLKQVKERLDTATSHVKETGNGHDSISTPPAESEAHVRAICEYTDALAEYVRVSKIYQDLVLRGMQSQVRGWE
jgi:hypothetical protein